jgi:tetratricopeptide (TPR) repeat protein
MKGWKDKLSGFFRAKGQQPEETITPEQAQIAWDRFVTDQVLPAFQDMKPSIPAYAEGTTYDIQQAPAGERWVRLTWIVAPSSDVLAATLSRRTIELPQAHIVLTYTILSNRQSAQTTAWCEIRIPNKRDDPAGGYHVVLEVLGDYRSQGLTSKTILGHFVESYRRYVLKDTYDNKKSGIRGRAGRQSASSPPLSEREDTPTPIIPPSLQVLNTQENQLLRTSAENQLYRTALLLNKTDRLEDALTIVETLIRLGRNDASMHCLRGQLLARLARYEEAQGAYEQAIHLKPDDVAAYNSKGALMAEMGKQQEALALFEQVISMDPTSAEAYYGKARALALLGQDLAALSASQQAIDLKPGHPFEAAAHKLQQVILDHYPEPPDVLYHRFP